jgi:hypothetical protein
MPAMTALRSTRLRARLVPGLILLLLLAQGLRLCLPVSAAEQPVSTVHLESLITTVADHHESDATGGDVDLSLDLIAKLADAGRMFAALLTFALVLFVLLPPSSVPRPAPGTLVFRPSRGYGLPPPSRGPPR